MTSIIPIDLSMAIYQDPARLASMLRGHIDELATCDPVEIQGDQSSADRSSERQV